MIKTDQEADFVQRILRTTGLLLLFQLPFTMFYLNAWAGLSILFGGVWGMINILFIAQVVRAAIRPGEIDKTKVALLLIVKFPLLYAAGYFLLSVGQFQPVLLVAGFSSLFLVAVLKVAGRAMLRMNDTGREHHVASGVAL